ncbi:MAG TPA: RelA/SpoT family protein [Bacteroidales bacterium]|jgi:GTP pyrophosphokinase|nr:RelA/SpoT family protein [Bacteroidales bacterium]HQN84885.1 RelA/SpoT family protein [Bacteroidales bacterium]
MQTEKLLLIGYDVQAERKEILKRYKRLLTAFHPKPEQAKEDLALIRKAFEVALDAHKDMRRKSGEPYIYHPLEVARICAEEIGLGATSIAAALLHDVVEDRSDLYSVEDIHRLFGDKIARICEGLTKIKEIFDHTQPSDQAEHYRKLLLTLSDDVRVILIKLADRLHNMRTLQYMRPEKQLKIAAETTYLFAPLAHRLGLYSIKSEMEDLALKFTEPEIYKEISRRMAESDPVRANFAEEFIKPIEKDLKEKGFRYRIMRRNKSVYSIWTKMKKKHIPFDEVYDVFAIRIILDVPINDERSACWQAYSIVTSHYRPKPDRLRDWISIPRANGYQALHTTVMSKEGKWVEVQIRSERMDEIAEKGYAAHWKYKGQYYDDKNIDNWLDRIRDMLQNGEAGALDFLEDVQGYLFSSEIFVFKLDGELRILPAGSTVLDFAYAINPDEGNHCIGANVNHKLQNRFYELKSGDQIEILTSKIQEPSEDWLDHVKTSRAKTRIREYIREKKKKFYNVGEQKVLQIFNKLNIPFTDEKLNELLQKTNRANTLDLYYDVAQGILDPKYISSIMAPPSRSWFSLNPFHRSKHNPNSSLSFEIIHHLRKNSELQLLDSNLDQVKYIVADCCKPIPGDDVIGYIDHHQGVVIHRAQCIEAVHLMSTFSHNVVKVKWTEELNLSVMTGIKLDAIDRKGLLHELSELISNEMDINIKSIHFESDNGVSEGIFFLYVVNVDQLNNLINKLKKVNAVQSVTRIDNYSPL